ncbi:MAG: hypothetical protein EBX41_00275 [Chitinophagia bacterium]|nr:hypothetical protein [Chitinophagia bacterium]
MKKIFTIPFRLLFPIFSVLLLLSSLKGIASHIVGADLFYVHDTGNRYKITFIAYGDCGPASAGAFATLPNSRPLICIYDGNTSITSITLTIDTPTNPYNGREITPVCPRDSNRTQCTIAASTIPGIKRFVYTGYYTVPYRSRVWRFVYTGGMAPGTGTGRAGAISNIAGGTIIQLIDTLNNTTRHNSNPLLTVVPTPFFCLNNSDSYTPGAIDADGDSLNFSLVSGMDGTTNCARLGGPVTYTGGTSAANPLRVATGSFSFDPRTGQVNFYPNFVQRALVVYNIEEFMNDTLMGTSQREMTFLVIPCTIPPPTGAIATSSGGGRLVDSTHFEICENTDTFSLYIAPRSTDTTLHIIVRATGLPPGASFVTYNDSSNAPYCVFSWTSIGVTPGTYTFFITLTDDNCPVYGTRTIAYTITVNPKPTVSAGGGATICIGGGILLIPRGATSYTWSPGTGLSCTACATPGASPTVTTVYTVTGSFATGCFSTDTVRITVNPNPGPIVGINNICIGDSTTLSDTTTGGRWSSSNPAIATINPTTGVVRGLAVGSVFIYYTVAATGCFVSRIFTVNQLPGSITGPATVCRLSSIRLTNTPAGGTWTVSDTNTAVITTPGGILTGRTVGSVTVTYSLPTGCYATANIVVNPIPDTITGPRVLCQGDTIRLNNTVSGGTWTTSNAGVATIIGSTNPAVVYGASGGSATLTYTLPAGCYATYAITVNPLPTAISAAAPICMRTTTRLTNGTPGGTWTSADSTIASIDPSTGIVTGNSYGTTTITYTLPTGCFVTRSITVNPIPSAITGVAALCQGYTTTLYDSVSGGTWSSSNTAVATVNSSTGYVTFVAPTSATITYTLPAGCYATYAITVYPLPATIGGPSFVCLHSSITETNSSAGGRWRSADSSIATIDSVTGVLTGMRVGTVVITYTLPTGCFITRSINVNPIPSIITGTFVLCQGYTTALYDSVSGGTWSSSNTAVATISAAGTVTAVAVGTTTITYILPGGCFATALFTVNPLPDTISGARYVCLRSTTTLTDRVGGGRWSSASPGVASIDSITGVVTGLAVGTGVVITYTLPTGCFVTRTIDVNPIPSAITGGTAICVGYTTTLYDSVAGGTWSSSATGIATVSTTGTVTGAAGGTATITYRLPGGCFVTIPVTVNPLPNAITGPTSVCVRSTVTLTDASAGGRWSSSNSTVAAIDSVTGVVRGVAIGVGTTITYTLPTGCFTTRTIDVMAAPSVITGPTALCVGNTITLTDSITGGIWSSSNTSIATVGIGSGVVTGVVAGSVTITYTIGACFAIYNITVNPLPATIGGPASVCMGSTITQTNTSAGGSWSSSNTGVATIDATTGVVNPVSTGTTTITYTLPTGCLITRVITVNPLPAAITGDSVVCESATITLSDASAGGSWTSSSTAIATVGAGSGVVTGVAMGSATITYTLPTTCYTTKSIRVKPLPVVGAIGGTTSVCVRSTIVATDTTPGGTWSVADTTIATISSTGTITGIRAGTTTISYAVTNDCGTVAATRTITVIPLPYAGTIRGLNSLCVRATITLTDSIAGGVWSSSTTSVATITTTGVVTGVSAGTTTISYAYTNACGTDVATYTVTVLALPALTISPTTIEYCIGASAAINAAGAMTYTWAPGTALTSTTGSTVITSATVTTTYSVTGVGANGCRDTASRIITVHPLPIITVGSATICNGNSVVLTAAGGFTYTWSPGTGLSATTGGSVTASPTDSIQYTVIGTDLFGCQNRAIATVNVNPIPPAPTVTTPINYCIGDAAAVLSASGTGLLWYNTATGGVGTGTAPTPSTASAGATQFYVSQTVDGCEGPRSMIEVDVFNNALTAFTYEIKYGCTRDTVIFTNNSQFCDGYIWHFGDDSNTVSTVKDPMHFYPIAFVNTNYTVKLFGYNNVCNDDSTTQVITITPMPSYPVVLTSVSGTQIINYGGSVQLNATGAALYYWTPNDGTLNNAHINNPIASPLADSTIYTVYGYDADGCLDSAYVKVLVIHSDNPIVPSAFSPNGDGLNDIFRIGNLRYGRLLEFRVYNRWGEEVFSTSDKNQGWDGTYKNEPQDIGVYDYFLVIEQSDGKSIRIKGNVTLVR